MGAILDEIEKAAGALAESRLFVLVLDEFDSLFGDTRGRPSDFLYRLLAAQEGRRAGS